MDDDALAKLGVLFSVGFDNGERPKCSNLLCKNTQNGLFVGETSHCQATNQQQVFAQSIDAKKMEKMQFNPAQPHHGPYLQKIFQGQLVGCKRKYGKWKCMDCSKFVRSYCSCTPGLMFCTDCFGNHRADLAIDSTHNT